MFMKLKLEPFDVGVACAVEGAKGSFWIAAAVELVFVGAATEGDGAKASKLAWNAVFDTGVWVGFLIAGTAGVFAGVGLLLLFMKLKLETFEVGVGCATEGVVGAKASKLA